MESYIVEILAIAEVNHNIEKKLINKALAATFVITKSMVYFIVVGRGTEVMYVYEQR